MESGFYDGVVVHERVRPVTHRFRYRLYTALLDLDEVPALVRAGLVSEWRLAPAAFLRRDHFGDPRRPLADCVREVVAERTGQELDGPIRLLTPLRTFGSYFAPLSLYYCYAADGRTPVAVVAEVQNTPWLERHCYVLWEGNRDDADGSLRFRHPKAFHVSPFMDMAVDYRWRLEPPGERVRVEIENVDGETRLFRAAMNLKRVPMTRRSRFALACRYPVQSARVTAAIYLQAFLLWRKKCPYYPHPKHCPASSDRPAPDSAVPAGSPVSSGTG